MFRKATPFIILALLSISLGLPLYNLLSVRFSKPATPVPALVAHRGSGGTAPENTLPAIDSGIAHKAPFIEVDIRQTLDGELVLMHDKTVNRTTNGQGLVHQQTYKQLSAFNAAGKFSASYPFVKIPLLRDVLEKIIHSRSILIIEIKDPGLYPGMVTRLATLVNEVQAKKKVMVFSFNKDILQEVNHQLPGVKTGIFCLGYENIQRFPASDYICPYFLSVLYDPSIISRIHRKGRQAFVWNVDTGFMMKYLHQKKVDGIITDRPDRFERIFY